MPRKMPRSASYVHRILTTVVHVALAISVLLAMGSGAAAADVDTILMSIDDFLDRQLSKFAPAADYPAGLEQAQLIQTYDLEPPTFVGGEDPLRHRADVYDSALAAIYFIRRDNLSAAKVLLDGIRLVQQFDPAADGRIRAAYYANDLLAPSRQSASIDAPNATVGNMSWAGIAMTQYYWAVKNQNDPALGNPADYLSSAESIASWIAGHDQCTGADGISGGLLGWDQTPVEWMSTEHNVDAHALARNLFHLTGQPGRSAMAQETQSFVQAIFDPQDGGRYLTGTIDCSTANPTPIPADAQSWTALAEIDAQGTNRDQALDWMWDNLLATDTPETTSFSGIQFADTGSHIQSEQSAGAAMALSITGRAGDAQQLLDQLELIRQFAPNADPQGLGVVATPWPGGAATGFGDTTYPNERHVASTVWSGLSLLVAQGDVLANPLFAFVTVLPGDANGNAVVDAGDYTIWANNFGIQNPAFVDGDFSLNGIVDAADYTIWANNFGMSVSSPDSTPAAVPEPSTLLMVGLGLLCLGLYGWQARK